LRGELTTIKELSKGEPKGYAYRTNSIQPEGYVMDITYIEEDNLKLSTEYNILNSYNA
jgi:hypothetical protein